MQGGVARASASVLVQVGRDTAAGCSADTRLAGVIEELAGFAESLVEEDLSELDLLHVLVCKGELEFLCFNINAVEDVDSVPPLFVKVEVKFVGLSISSDLDMSGVTFRDIIGCLEAKASDMNGLIGFHSDPRGIALDAACVPLVPVLLAGTQKVFRILLSRATTSWCAVLSVHFTRNLNALYLIVATDLLVPDTEIVCGFVFALVTDAGAGFLV